jgi:SAM-dependent methyltransferase
MAMTDPHLKDAFGVAAPEHFAWQTKSAFVSVQEARLVQAAFTPVGSRALDLGCAEGATLKHLGEPSGAVGVDLFVDKLLFARTHVRGARFIAAAGEALPFASGSFDHVILRDVVHHVPDATLLFAECRRVLARGGRIDVLEPSRYNPLILLHALTQKAERGELRSSAGRLTRLLASHFDVVSVSRYQAFLFHRVAFHPSLGRPQWARSAFVRRFVETAERAAAWIVPRPAWAYIHVRAMVREDS